MNSHNKPTKETLEKWHNDPNNWKWGWIYYNKEDKRLFPPKRNKMMGYTTNFANVLSIVALVALIGLVTLFVVILERILH